MKKITKALAAIIIALLICGSVPSYAFDYGSRTDGYYTYIVSSDKGEATITDVNEGIKGDIVIPFLIQGYPVVSIGAEAFSGCGLITEIIIPYTVSSIGDRAFNNCTALTEMEIPASVLKIGENVFNNCTGITVKGLTNSCAQSYTNENNILFISTRTVLQGDINGNGEITASDALLYYSIRLKKSNWLNSRKKWVTLI